MDYQVDLETFRGPLDLLLYLVKRNEVDICDIPISKITEQFLSYLNIIQMIDVEWTGDFLVMASTLMEIKSKLLLPRSDEITSEEDADPRLQLVKQLIEYKKFKDAAKRLDEQAERQMLRVPRQPVDVPKQLSADKQPIRKVELWDLVSAFGRLLRETTALQPQQIVMDETPMSVHMEQTLERIRKKGRVTFSELFSPPFNRGRLIGLFLAILELIKTRKIQAEQPALFGEITIGLVDEGE